MTYALQPGEPVGEGLRRCAAEELDGAVAWLRGAGPDEVADAVHDARKSCKKVRALLRLARAALGDVRDTENAALRDTARRLSGARDAEVLAALVADVAADERAPRAVGGAAEALGARRDGVATVVLHGDAASVAAALEAAAGRVARWPLDGGVDDLLARGLGKLAKQERTRRDRALAAGLRPSADGAPRPEVDELRHAWRRRAKDLWYGALLLQQVSPPAAAAVERLDDLGSALGEDHDLGVLAGHLRADPADSGVAALLHRALPRATDRRDLLGLLERRRRPLVERAQALALGRPQAAEPDALVEAWLTPLRDT